jgi:periplasmic protein TonB
MGLGGRTQLIALSLGCHAALGLGLAAIPPRHHRETIAITLAETKKPKAAAHVDPPPEPPDPPAKATPRPARAKTAAPAAKAAVTPAANAQAPSSLDALPDFGLSLSGGPGGLAIPAGGGGGGAPAATQAAKVLSRKRPAADDCDEPPSKPTALTRPTAVYPRSQEGSGVAGKVRVEITVDEHGRVISARVLQSLGPAFDEAALAAARAYTFEPAVRCGKPTPSTLRIGFSF